MKRLLTYRTAASSESSRTVNETITALLKTTFLTVLSVALVAGLLVSKIEAGKAVSKSRMSGQCQYQAKDARNAQVGNR